MARGAGGRRNAGAHAVRAVQRERAIGTDVDPVRLEIFNNLFMAIAEEMGSRCNRRLQASTSRSGSIFPAQYSTRMVC